MIDLHCHILPGIDDGPGTMEDAVEMARVAARDGIHTIVATPHAADWTLAYKGDVAELDARIAQLQMEVDRQEIPLRILSGLEVYLTPETPSMYERGSIFSLNSSRYVLVEFPFEVFPAYTEHVLFELQLRGLVPLIAHAERYTELASKLEVLEQMVMRGMLLQVTSGSLLGYFGSQVRETAETLLTRRMAHVIASDGHSPVRRAPQLSEAVRRAAQIAGEEAATKMVTAVPLAIVEDRDVTVPEPEPASRRSWFPFRR